MITYDEHGGFYDHVNPFNFKEKAEPVSGIDHHGVRVPTFVISPWVERGKVSNVVFDHTSIAKTIIRRFMSANPPDMGGLHHCCQRSVNGDAIRCPLGSAKHPPVRAPNDFC